MPILRKDSVICPGRISERESRGLARSAHGYKHRKILHLLAFKTKVISWRLLKPFVASPLGLRKEARQLIKSGGSSSRTYSSRRLSMRWRSRRAFLCFPAHESIKAHSKGKLDQNSWSQLLTKRSEKRSNGLCFQVDRSIPICVHVNGMHNLTKCNCSAQIRLSFSGILMEVAVLQLTD